jgi:hypothetical protein
LSRIGDANGGSLLETPIAIACATASKKKKLVKRLILTSMTTWAAMISRKTMMFMTRTALRITYPGPARDSFNEAIMIAVGVQNKERCNER